MVEVNHVVVQAPQQPKKGKKRYRVLHDNQITPPRDSKQIMAAIKQQYDLLSFTIEDGKATALVQKKKKVTDDAE